MVRGVMLMNDSLGYTSQIWGSDDLRVSNDLRGSNDW